MKNACQIGVFLYFLKNGKKFFQTAGFGIEKRQNILQESESNA